LVIIILFDTKEILKENRMITRRKFIKNGTTASIGIVTLPSLMAFNRDESIIPRPLINCYYYAPHNHSLLQQHIQYDLDKMVSLGTDIVTFCIQEDQLFNWHSRRVRNFIKQAHNTGLKVHVIPNRWAGLLAGWLDGFSRWSIQNMDTWYENPEYRMQAFSDPKRHKVHEHYKKHLRALIEDFEVDGIIWDEPRPYAEKEVIEFLDQMSCFCKTIRNDLVMSIFAEAGALHHAEWYADMKHIDYAGADGHLRSEDHIMHRMKNTIFKVHDVFTPVLNKAGIKTFFLIEGQRHRDEDLDNYLENLERAFSLPMDHIMFYYSAHEMSNEKEEIFNRETWKVIARRTGKI
jgi:hypothetical protein